MAKDRLTSRYWEILLYPDAIVNWWQTMWKNNIILPLAVSPLHDPSLNADQDADTEQKKHYHAIIRYPNSTTDTTIKKIVDELYIDHGPKPLKVYDLMARYRYLVHLDNPEKQQFKEPGDSEKIAFDKIQCFCGFDIDVYKELDGVEIQKLMDELEQIINVKHFITLRALAEYIQLLHRGDLMKVLRSHTGYFNLYITGFLTEAKYEKDLVQLDDPDAYGGFQS